MDFDQCAVENMSFNDLSIGIIFSFIISCVYAGLGLFLLITDNVFSLSGFQKSGFGLILIAYGIFRLYRTLKQKKENDFEEDE